MIYVTGDTHGERARFQYSESPIEKHLKEGDILIVCGDFGFLWDQSESEQAFLTYLAEKPYYTLFVDGNHENFNILNEYKVEKWCGGNVHIIQRNEQLEPKVIHLMRGQVYSIEGNKIFTFGGAHSIDKMYRKEGYSWWEEEMPNDAEMKEAIDNLKKHNNKVDYIITHAAPESTMVMFHPEHQEEKPLNNFLQWVKENVEYVHWYFGHLHEDKDLPYSQTVLWYDMRNLVTNEVYGFESVDEDS